MKDNKRDINPLPNITSFKILENKSEITKLPTLCTFEPQILMDIPRRVTQPLIQANTVVPIFVQPGTVILSQGCQMFPVIDGRFF